MEILKKLQWIDHLYGSVIKAGTHNAKYKNSRSSCLLKTCKDLNIVLINELSIVFKHLNIDTLDAINAAQQMELYLLNQD